MGYKRHWDGTRALCILFIVAAIYITGIYLFAKGMIKSDILEPKINVSNPTQISYVEGGNNARH